MARLSDIIEDFIKELMEYNQSPEIEIQRNELANYFSCAPSQINYVLTTRFTQDKGYYIESRRGGGGSIKITKISYTNDNSLVELIVQGIGEQITNESANQLIDELYERGIFTQRELIIIKSVLNDRTLSGIIENKNKIRADILKSIILNVFK